MLRSAVLLLCLTFLPLAAAVEEPGRESGDTVTIENDLSRLVISLHYGAIQRFEQKDIHPIELPSHAPAHPEAMGGPGQGGRPALAVLAGSYSAQSSVVNQLHNVIPSDVPGMVYYGISTADAWRLAGRSATSVTLAYDNATGQSYRLTYSLRASRPTVDVRLEIENGGSVLLLNPAFRPISGIHQDFPPNEAPYIEAFIHQGGQAGSITSTTMSGKEQTRLGGGDYVGLRSRFVAAWCIPGRLAVEGGSATAPAVPAVSTLLGLGAADAGQSQAASWYAIAVPQSNPQLGASQGMIAVGYSAPVSLQTGQRLVQEWSITATGLRRVDVERIDELERRIEFTSWFYRFFKSITQVLTWLLGIIVAVVQSQGVAVILLTLLVKLAMIKLTFKQQGSMLKMQKLAPEMRELQNKYGSNRQLMAQKQMELWKKHGVSPLGGCLPLLVQMPIFMALYSAFQYSADMRGEPFLWVHDLTLPDQIWGTPISFLGGWVLSLNPLPIIYIAVTIFMSLTMPMPTGGDPTQEQTAKMMRWMPVIFGFIFYNMPSGLVLYFTANAVFSTIETRFVKWKLGIK